MSGNWACATNQNFYLALRLVQGNTTNHKRVKKIKRKKDPRKTRKVAMFAAADNKEKLVSYLVLYCVTKRE